MRPEDIDKLFKERLGNSAPTPPMDLWSRLQDKMEAEMPTPQLKPKEEKKSFMWIYSSVAASLSLLLAVGVVFYNIKSTPEVSDAIIAQERPMLQETPYFKEPATEQAAIAETAIPEKNSDVQATDYATPASNITETVDKPATLAKAPAKSIKQPKAKAGAANQPKATVQQAIAHNTPTPVKAVETVTESPVGKTTSAPTSSTAAAANANLNASPVEITIKRAVASAAPTAAPAESPADGGFDKKAKLAKNIFKQVRNLANGEQVELDELGIRADKLAVQTQIGKQKISKVINL